VAIYLIVLTDNTEGVLEKIDREWRDRYYQIDEKVMMISVKGISAASQIAEKIGLDTETDAPSGMVVPIDKDTVSGVLRRSAVDWYRSANNG